MPGRGQRGGSAFPDHYTGAVAVTPNDGVDLTDPCIALVAQVAGNVAVDTTGGETNVVVGIAAGIPLRLAVKRVRATSTTATGIVALYP